jgi:hypothetical protein
MEIITDIKREMSTVQETRPKPNTSILDTLFSQTDKNEELAACDRQAQELVDQIFDRLEDG